MISLLLSLLSLFPLTWTYILLLCIFFAPALLGRAPKNGRPLLRQPSTHPLASQSIEVSFTTKDGYVRKGVLTKRENAKGIILLCHPATYNKEFMTDYQQHLFSHFHCFRFDFRKHGELAVQYSEKTKKEACCTFGKKEVFDIEAAVDYIKSLPDMQHLPLYGFGISLGGASLIEAQAQHSFFDALIVQASFDRLVWQVRRSRHIFTVPPMHVFLFKEPARWLVRKTYGVHLFHVDPIFSIEKIEKPIFLIHSEDDKLIPVRVCKRMKKAAKKCSFIKTWMPKKGGHTGTFRLFPEKYKRKCLAFLEKVAALVKPDKAAFPSL